MARYLIGFLVTIGLIALIIILLVSGGSSSKQPTSQAVDLRKYASSSSAQAQLIISGPIVADQNYRQLEIDVSQSQVSLTVYTGYQRQVLRSKSYANNATAFSEFTYGLQRSGFSLGSTDKSQADPRGYCVNGIRDNYAFANDSKNLFAYWSNTCGQGTFKGNISTVVRLFKNQVPDYNSMTSDLSL